MLEFEIDGTSLVTQDAPADVISLHPSTLEIEKLFSEIESKLPFREDKTISKYLSFSENLEAPIHRWFLFKEGYSHHLVKEVLSRFPPPSSCLAVLDPFYGSGTTLLAAQRHAIPSVGLELSPFAAFLGLVKTKWNQINPDELEKVLERVLCDSIPFKSQLPELSTFHKEKYFPNGNAIELFRLRSAIRRRQTSRYIKDVLTLALLSTIEDVSYLHKDGRLLRYFPRELLSPKEALYKRTKIIIQDLKELESLGTEGNRLIPESLALQGDARSLDSVLCQHQIFNQFGLILYSPPYPNNFDYSEIYKCELWLAGFLKSQKEWRKLRLSTFRSHPSCSFPETCFLQEDSMLGEVYRLVEKMSKCTDIGERGSRARSRAPKVIRGYFDDVYLMLQQQKLRLAPGGYIVCVVGNSRHGNLYIPADTLIAKIGQAIGLELIEICIARHRQSRGQRVQKLRESLVVFRKPE